MPIVDETMVTDAAESTIPLIPEESTNPEDYAIIPTTFGNEEDEKLTDSE